MAQLSKKAAQLRHHRKVFELALVLGCTPADAEHLMRQVEAREKHRARCAKLNHPTPLPPLRLPTSRADFQKWDAPWMGRD